MTPVEAKIARRLHEFDLGALLRLLAQIGYQQQEIHLRSHHTTASQSRLLQRIEFLERPERQVLITLNLGLLSVQSPLPNYFMKMIDYAPMDSGAFIDFISFFDDMLLRDYVSNLFPESNTRLYPDWEQTKRRYLFLLDQRSCATLHWLFSGVFPELRVVVEKSTQQRELQTTPLRLGQARLGSDAVFGKRSRVPVSGRSVTLTAEHGITSAGIPWPQEIRERLERLIFPVLRMVGVDLQLALVIREQETHARLSGESHLGYEKVQGGEASYRRINLFQGHLVE